MQAVWPLTRWFPSRPSCASRLALVRVLRWADEGKIDPFVSNVYALSDYKKAMLARWNGEIVGGSAIHP